MPASRSGGCITAELVEVTLPGVLGTPGSTGRCVVVLRGRQRGQCGRSDTGGEQLRRCSLLTCGWTGRNSGDGEVRGRGRRYRGRSWHQGEAAALLRWGYGAAELCGRGGAGSSALTERGKEAARVCGRRGEWMGCRAAAGGAKIEAGGDPGGSRSMVTPP